MLPGSRFVRFIFSITNPQFMPDRPGRNAAHEFGQVLKIQGYPTMVIMDKKGEITNNIVGFRNTEQLLPELKK